MIALSEFILGIVAALFFGSFFEYLIHRYVMHDRKLRDAILPKRDDTNGIYHKHAKLHHGVFYGQFDLETDPVGKELNIVFTWDDTALVLLGLSPALFIIGYFISPAVALAFIVVAVLHNRVWNLLHHEMHIPTHAWWTKTASYRFLARHHFMHHQKTGTNFNVVLPLADFVLATVASPNKDDIVEMRRLGFLTTEHT